MGTGYSAPYGTEYAKPLGNGLAYSFQGMKTKIRENRVHAGIRDDQGRDAGKRLLD